MTWLKKYAPILGIIAFIAVALYIIIGILNVVSGPIFSIFSKYSHPLRGLFDICTMVASFVLPATIYGVFHGYSLEEIVCCFKNKWLNFVLILVTLLGTINIPFCYFEVGSTQIGDFFEKSVYTEDYYIEINSTKHPATILRTHDIKSGEILYILEEIHFKNDSVYFTPPDVVDIMPSREVDYMIPGVTTVVSTDDGETYSVTLTTERVK